MKSQKTLKEKQKHQSASGEHILLIDDDKSACSLGAEILGEFGYKVMCFTNCKEAIKKFSENPGEFHLVISDYSMPHCNGQEFIKEIRKINPDIPALLMTGQLDALTKENLQTWDFDDIIEKPYHMQDIFRKVSNILKQTRSNNL